MVEMANLGPKIPVRVKNKSQTGSSRSKTSDDRNLATRQEKTSLNLPVSESEDSDDSSEEVKDVLLQSDPS